MQKTIVVGIAGGTGSGKTTLARNLYGHFGGKSVLLCQDYYYKSFDHLTYEESCRVNYDHPDSFDMEYMISQVKDLKAFCSINRPVYSFLENKRLSETVEEQAKQVIILEGILLFENPELLSLMDIRVFVDTDADIRLVRRLTRDIHERGRDLDSVISQYMKTVKPMHDAFVEPCKKKADVIIPNGGLNQVACSMLIAKINSMLK